MTIEVETTLGKFRKVTTDREGHSGWLHLCPGCGVWRGLNKKQIVGQVSAWCDPSGEKCSYHETHDYNAALKAAGEDL